MQNKTGFKAEFNSTNFLLLKNISITFACPRKKNGIEGIEGVEGVIICPGGRADRQEIVLWTILGRSQLAGMAIPTPGMHEIKVM